MLSAVRINARHPPVRVESGKEPPGPHHIRAIGLIKALEQLLFLRAGSHDDQGQCQPTAQEEEPVGRSQCIRQESQRRGVVERVPNPAIWTVSDQSVLFPCDNGVRQVLPEG